MLSGSPVVIDAGELIKLRVQRRSREHLEHCTVDLSALRSMGYICTTPKLLSSSICSAATSTEASVRQHNWRDAGGPRLYSETWMKIRMTQQDVLSRCMACELLSSAA